MVLSDLSNTNGYFVNCVLTLALVKIVPAGVVEIEPGYMKVLHNDLQSNEKTIDFMQKSAIVIVLVMDVRGYTHPTRILHEWFNIIHHL